MSDLARNTDISESAKNLCPRCGNHIPDNETPGAYPGAVSRTDNKTEICSACGQLEAFETFPFGQPLSQEFWISAPVGPEIILSEQLNAHPNRDALTEYLKQSLRSGTPEDITSFDCHFLGTWSSIEMCVLDLLENAGVLDETPAQIPSDLGLEKLASLLYREGILYWIDAGNGFVWVFKDH